jgi:hypothetical protein
MTRTRLLLLAVLSCCCCCCCSAQRDAAIKSDVNGDLVLSDGKSNSVTLQALMSELSTLNSLVTTLVDGQAALAASQTALASSLAALSASQAATAADVCRVLGPAGRVSTFQSIATQHGQGLKFFSIGTQSYLAIANRLNGAVPNYATNSQILRFNPSTGSFVSLQLIASIGAVCWEFFSIGNQSYLALANSQQSPASFSIDSPILRFDAISGTFLPFQLIATMGASDWEFFTIGSQSYLAVANSRDGSSSSSIFAVNSMIYRFDGSSFILFQSIATMGAVDWEFFTIGNQSFLALANNYDGSSHSINSIIYRFDGSNFAPFQSVFTMGAAKWCFFSMGNQSYLALANNQNNGNYSTNSQLYRFNGSTFLPFQSIATTGAADWSFFSMGSQNYLVVAHWYSGTSYVTNSMIYRFNGTMFVPFQPIPTLGGIDLEFFRMNGQSYLAVGNTHDGTTVNVNSVILRLSDNCFQSPVS